MMRRDFVSAAEEYEKSNIQLQVVSEKKERGILVYKISMNKRMMEETLKKMISLNARAANKQK